MKIFDPLYGSYELSPISSELCLLPEVRRLAQIRLLNSISPSLATLSELRRYAHTLGVLHLFNIWKMGAGKKYLKEELDALEIAIILHDVATPPFGHLFEYILRDESGWDHEAEAVTTLLKSYSPASTAQPIFVGKTPKVLDYIERRGINLNLVKDILSKQHKLSALIMGVLDFDNIDNVWRMAWAMGMPINRSNGLLLAEQIDVSNDGALVLTKSVEPILKEWAKMRRLVYGVLIFDQPTVASQTLLTYCIRKGIERGLISNSDWFLTDESLLEKLSYDSEIKDLIAQQYLGVLPEPVVTIQLPLKELPLYELGRAELESQLTSILEEKGKHKWWIYVFKEKGSFEKQVKYYLKDGGVTSFGTPSKSLIVSVFSGKMLSMAFRKEVISAILAYFSKHGLELSDFIKVLEFGNESIKQDGRLFP